MPETPDWKTTAPEIQRWIESVAQLESIARQLARALWTIERPTEDAVMALDRAISAGLLTTDGTPGRPASGINRGPDG